MSAPDRPRERRRATYLLGGTAPEHYPPPTLPEFAFVGRSNAGKSTLVNRLASDKALARTSSTPGRTQAIQFFSIPRPAGKSVVFADLPGYGFAKAPVAVRRAFIPMVQRYLDARTCLAGVILIADVRRDPTADEEAILDRVQAREVPLLLVLSKSDKLSKSRLNLRVRAVADAYGLDPQHFFPYSGLTGRGLSTLWSAMDELAAEWVAPAPEDPSPDPTDGA